MDYADLDDEAQAELLRPVAAEGARRLGLDVVDVVLAHHGYNTTFRARSTHGVEHALRVLTNSRSTGPELRAQHAWVHAIARETPVAVPDPVVGPDGEDHAVVPSEAVGRDVVVVAARWLPGVEVGTPTVEQAHELGVAMATLHEHATGWALPPGASLPAFDDPLFGDPDVLSGWPADAEGTRLLAEAGERARAAFAAIADHPRHPVHADLHGGNLLWDGGRLAVLDFDDSGVGAAALDLAISTFYLRDDVDGAEAGLRQGYQAIRPLPDVDHVVFEALVASRQLLLANDLLTTSTASLRTQAQGYLATTLERLDHWTRTGRFTRHP